MTQPKIFGIGFPRTGTSSLGAALEILGYRVCREATVLPPRTLKRSPDAIVESLAEVIDRYDAFEDLPWPKLYRAVDRKYPGSKFVLTVRDNESWLRSMVNKFGSRHGRMKEWLFGKGAPLGNEGLYVELYERFNSEVQEYFTERPDDLLVFDVFQGNGWNELCAFLGKPVPEGPFPHANRQPPRTGLPRDSLRAKVRRILVRAFKQCNPRRP